MLRPCRLGQRHHILFRELELREEHLADKGHVAGSPSSCFEADRLGYVEQPTKRARRAASHVSARKSVAASTTIAARSDSRGFAWCLFTSRPEVTSNRGHSRARLPRGFVEAARIASALPQVEMREDSGRGSDPRSAQLAFYRGIPLFFTNGFKVSRPLTAA